MHFMNGQHSLTSVERPLDTFWNLHKVELFSALISHLLMIFQAGNVHESASLFNLKEKQIDMKGSRILTHDPEDPVSTPH